MTPEQKIIRARTLEAEAMKLRAEAKAAGQKHEPLSPRTKLPVSHPESQAVERERYGMGVSLNEWKPEEHETPKPAAKKKSVT